jgi:hypothetical protein
MRFAIFWFCCNHCLFSCENRRNGHWQCIKHFVYMLLCSEIARFRRTTLFVPWATFSQGSVPIACDLVHLCWCLNYGLWSFFVVVHRNHDRVLWMTLVTDKQCLLCDE